VLLVSLVLVACVCVALPVHSQGETISISNFQYPNEVVLGKPANVSFTVNYSGLSVGVGGDYLVLGVLSTNGSAWAIGSVSSSSPENCSQTSPSTGEAVCGYYPAESEGSENVAFSLTIASTGSFFSQGAEAYVSYFANTCPNNGWCTGVQQVTGSFSISIVSTTTEIGQLPSNSQSASLTVESPANVTANWNYFLYLLPIVVIAVMAGIALLTRRTTVSNLPTPEPMMYCSQCGAIISRNSKFCKECGTKL